MSTTKLPIYWGARQVFRSRNYIRPARGCVNSSTKFSEKNPAMNAWQQLRRLFCESVGPDSQKSLFLSTFMVPRVWRGRTDSISEPQDQWLERKKSRAKADRTFIPPLLPGSRN